MKTGNLYLIIHENRSKCQEIINNSSMTKPKISTNKSRNFLISNLNNKKIIQKLAFINLLHLSIQRLLQIQTQLKLKRGLKGFYNPIILL